jgi:hypothetical protein
MKFYEFFNIIYLLRNILIFSIQILYIIVINEKNIIIFVIEKPLIFLTCYQIIIIITVIIVIIISFNKVCYK